MWVRSLGWEEPLEKQIAAHSSILASSILVPWTEEPHGLQSTGCKELDTTEATYQACMYNVPCIVLSI